MDVVVQMILLFGLPIERRHILKIAWHCTLCIQCIRPWVFYLDCTISDDRIVSYPGNNFTGMGWGYLSDSCTGTVQEAHLFKLHCCFSSTFNFDSSGGCEIINFLTNLNDHFINSRFSYLCFIGNWLLVAWIATLFWITSSIKQYDGISQIDMLQLHGWDRIL